MSEAKYKVGDKRKWQGGASFAGLGEDSEEEDGGSEQDVTSEGVSDLESNASEGVSVCEGECSVLTFSMES